MILGAIIFGWYLSLIIEIPTKYLSKIKFLPYKAAVIISSLVMFFLLAYAIYSIFPILIEEGQKLFPAIGKRSQDINFADLIKSEKIDPGVIDWLNDLTGQLGQKFSDFGISIINSLIQQIPNAMTATIIFVITASYFTTLTPIFRNNIWRFFPRSTRDKSIRFVSEFYKDIRHFIGGQAIIAGLVGSMVGFGAFISGIPYAVFLGFLSGITNFVPFLGVIVAAVPALLLGFVHEGVAGFIKMAIVLLASNLLETWLLNPKIQGARMNINWFAILIAILLCGAILGLAGVLLGIPLLLFFRRFWEEYVQSAYKKL